MSARMRDRFVAPNPTPRFWGATPVWDSNSLDSGQAVEIVEVATTYGRWSAGRSPEQRKSNSATQLWTELGLLRSDWLGGRDSNPDTLVQRRPDDVGDFGLSRVC